jgi:excisionase family DNA binding protein
MDFLQENLKRLIKESVREVLREEEFSKPQRSKEPSLVKVKPLQTPSKKLAVKLSEAAEIVSLSIPTLRRMISNGSLKVSRKTRHVLIPMEELERIMKV